MAIVLIILMILIIVIYYTSTKNHDFFRKRGIKGPRPLPFLGNTLPQVLKPANKWEMDNYNTYGPVYGIFLGQEPILTIGDPELLKQVLVKDFHKFTNRNIRKAAGPIFKHNLMNLRDEDWKRVRVTSSPSFTTGKIKSMIFFMDQCIEKTMVRFEKAATDHTEINLREVFGKLIMDIIAICAFGTKPDDVFDRHAESFFKSPFWKMTITALLPPSIIKFLTQIFNFTIAPSDSMEFFVAVAKNLINERKTKAVTQIDFLQLLMEAEEDLDIMADINESSSVNQLVDDVKINRKMNGKLIIGENRKGKLTQDEIIANIILIFVAGYETTASLITYSGHILAMHPDIQERLYKEISENITNQKTISYNELLNLQYLDAFISESLRMYSPILRLDREFGTDYKLGPNGPIVPKGTSLYIPFYAIHHDEKNFPEPFKFKPERFFPENKKNIKPFTYMPFGAGPRNCIGIRFALVEAKLALVKILLRYKFVACANTRDPPKFEPARVFLQSNQVIVKIEERCH